MPRIVLGLGCLIGHACADPNFQKGNVRHAAKRSEVEVRRVGGFIANEER